MSSMFKLCIFLLSTITLINCSSYTIKNSYSEEITVGEVNLEAGACMELVSMVFGFFGDFPIEVQANSESLTDEDTNTSFSEGNYEVNSEGFVVSLDKEDACKVKGIEGEEEVTDEEDPEEEVTNGEDSEELGETDSTVVTGA